MNFAKTLDELEAAGNLRQIPAHQKAGELIDLTSNDYLGMAADRRLQQEFLLRHASAVQNMLTASASRLLALNQQSFNRLEEMLESVYGIKALIFNSGYHANTGIIAALASRDTLVVADKLVHASMIDGIRLSGAPFERFRHNDLDHLERILAKKASGYDNILIAVESVYSMDGDSPDLERLLEIKKRYPGVMLYVDEAHAVGVCGPSGLGLAAATGQLEDFDVIIGTFGKALASSGAFCLVSDQIRNFLINRARSLIFSTALPPLCAEWSIVMLGKSLEMDSERRYLKSLASLFGPGNGHIVPFLTGSSERAVRLSGLLSDEGYKVLPIRTPTVPPGTERLRISLSAALDYDDVKRFVTTLGKLNHED